MTRTMSAKRKLRIWICDACGARSTWPRSGGKTRKVASWRWFVGVESERNKERGYILPAIVCSDKCEITLLEKWRHEVGNATVIRMQRTPQRTGT